jgi:hypothetical protein
MPFNLSTKKSISGLSPMTHEKQLVTQIQPDSELRFIDRILLTRMRGGPQTCIAYPSLFVAMALSFWH